MMAPLLPLLTALWLGALAFPAASPAAERIEVVTVVLAEPEVAPGREQIVQVTLRNNGDAPAPVGVRLATRHEDAKNGEPPVQRAVTLNPYDEQRIFFSLKAPRRPGRYRVQVELHSADFRKRMADQQPAFYATFTVRGEVVARAAPPPAAPRLAEPAPGAAAIQPKTPSFQPPRGLSFESPDLIWENFDVAPLSLLVGDTGRIRADLRNVGGDIAREIGVRVQSFNTRIPNRADPVAESNVVALAPGEKIEMEWEFKFPEGALLGEYRVVLEARATAGTPEQNVADNRLVSERAVQLNHIRLVFPDPGYLFEEAGLFLFRWESKLYDEFKVQVGVDPNFEDAGRFFDIPQGEKWTRDQEIVPLEGELPGMAKGLMERENSPIAHWRVVGRKADRTGYSRVQAFTIRLGAGEPAPGEVPGPEELEAAPPPPPARQPAAPAPPAREGGAQPPAETRRAQPPAAPAQAAPQSGAAAQGNAPPAPPTAPAAPVTPTAPATPSVPAAGVPAPPLPPASAPSRPEPGGPPTSPNPSQ